VRSIYRSAAEVELTVFTNLRISVAHASGSSTTHAWAELRKHNELRCRDRGMERLGVRQRRPSISVAMQDERRHVDGGQHRPEVGLPSMWPAARIDAGRMFSRIIVANAASRSAGMRSENKPG
jgi:hypothetical protein